MTSLESLDMLTYPLNSSAGSWFDSYGRFAADLLHAQKSGQRLPRLVVIQAPSRVLVASAMNLGFSAQAIFSAETGATQIPLESFGTLALGSVIQVRFQWHQEDQKVPLKTRRVVTGVLKEFIPQRAGARFPSIRLALDSKLESIALTNNLTSLYLMPSETPLGQETQTAPAEGVNLERWGSFFSQQRPTACTFTYFSEFEREISLTVSDHLLLSQYLQVPSLSLKELARLDRLTDDEHIHFVNSYEMLRKMKTMEADISHLVDPFSFIILDGNAAVADLVGNSLFREKVKICILDSSNHERFSDALANISSEAMHLERPIEPLQIQTIDEHLGLFAERWF